MDTARRSRSPFRLERRELVLIVAFWAFLAVLSTANRVLDPRGPGLQLFPPSAPVLLTLFESGLWTLITPGVFWLAAHLNPGRMQRIARVPLLLAFGLVLAAGVNAAIDFVRFEVLDAPAWPGAERTVLYGLRRLWFLNDFIVYLGILAAGFAREYFHRYRAQNEEAVRLQAQTAMLQTQLAEAQLAALRMQLNPHFLFNTLHAVSALVERDPAGVRRMIARLSELLRSTLDGSAPERSVEEEVAFAARYLEIMQVRYEGKLDIAMDVAPDTRQALVPTLILQPLVENAIKHGVSKTRGAGRVAVEVRREADHMLLSVRDSGPGPSAERPNGPSANGGLGLRNTAERLHQMYGDRASVRLERADNGETKVEVELPYRGAVGAGPVRTAAVSS